MLANPGVQRHCPFQLVKIQYSENQKEKVFGEPLKCCTAQGMRCFFKAETKDMSRNTKGLPEMDEVTGKVFFCERGEKK